MSRITSRPCRADVKYEDMAGHQRSTICGSWDTRRIYVRDPKTKQFIPIGWYCVKCGSFNKERDEDHPIDLKEVFSHE